MCIDIVELWFGIANEEFFSLFDRVICRPHDSGGVLSFQVFIICGIVTKSRARLCTCTGVGLLGLGNRCSVLLVFSSLRTRKH